MPRAPSRNNNSSRPAREHKAPIIFNVPVELPSKEKKEPKFIVQRQNVNGLKTKPSYFAMVAKALYECRDPFHGMKFNDICKYIETNYPVTLEYRRFLKLALAKAVEDGAFVQLGPRNYKLATEERRRMKSGKTSRRRSSTKASSEKKKVTKKRSSAKKEGDEKKKSPKKRTTKNSKGDGEKKSTKKKRASKEEPKKSTKRKSVGKVDDEDESPKKKSKSEKRKSEKSSGEDNTLVWVSFVARILFDTKNLALFFFSTSSSGNTTTTVGATTTLKPRKSSKLLTKSTSETRVSLTSVRSNLASGTTW